MDKLTVLNDALSATGNQTLSVLNDGSDEWQVADRAFDRAVRDLSSRHNWPFARVSANLVVADDADNPSLRYAHAFELPDNVVHLRAVLVAGAPLTSYEIVGNYVCCDYTQSIAVEGYAMPPDAIWHPQAAEILTTYVEAGCLSGLNEDFAEARQRKMEAEGRLLEARPRIDRQNPVKNAFISRVAIARYTRRGAGGGLAVDRNLVTPVPPAGSILLED